VFASGRREQESILTHSNKEKTFNHKGHEGTQR
jgi:hypothetical protein